MFKKSIFAGILISLGAAIYLKLGGIIGALMFSFGLLCVIHFKAPLYTGTAGFINFKNINDWKNLILILLGNIIGCFLFSLIPIEVSGTKIIESRINAGVFNCLWYSIGCGFIMTIVVKAGRDKNIIPILFGVPIFILLGFYHSIADSYYLFKSSVLDIKEYIVIILGNFIGCNIPNLLNYENNK